MRSTKVDYLHKTLLVILKVWHRQNPFFVLRFDTIKKLVILRAFKPEVSQTQSK